MKTNVKLLIMAFVLLASATALSVRLITVNNKIETLEKKRSEKTTVQLAKEKQLMQLFIANN
ncbi:hypothetical protein GC194_14645 [bacterium]|nr:hypothetical protein [bacterium]